jgi:hypothetical protein
MRRGYSLKNETLAEKCEPRWPCALSARLPESLPRLSSPRVLPILNPAYSFRDSNVGREGTVDVEMVAHLPKKVAISCIHLQQHNPLCEALLSLPYLVGDCLLLKSFSRARLCASSSRWRLRYN